MIKPDDPRRLAVDLIPRSTCQVQVGASIVDKWGHIMSWGWNHSGFSGFGEHAEAHAIRRANKKRLQGATIYVASRRARNKKTICSKPCSDCQALIDKWNIGAMYRDSDGVWK